MRRIGATQLGQGLGLNLTDPLPRHAEFPANFFQRADLAVVKPEAEAHDILLALGEVSQCLTDGFVEESPGGRIIGDDRSSVLNQVGKTEVVLVTDRLLQ